MGKTPPGEQNDQRFDAQGTRAVHGPPIRFSTRTMPIADAKSLWARDPNVDRVEVQPCPCEWRREGGEPHPCALKAMMSTPTVLHTRAELSEVAETCSVMPVFRTGTPCPKTGCGDEATLGGWCTNIMPDGTYHCLHCWCHRKPFHGGPLVPCNTTVHQCVVWLTNSTNQSVAERTRELEGTNNSETNQATGTPQSTSTSTGNSTNQSVSERARPFERNAPNQATPPNTSTSTSINLRARDFERRSNNATNQPTGTSTSTSASNSTNLRVRPRPRCALPTPTPTPTSSLSISSTATTTTTSVTANASAVPENQHEQTPENSETKRSRREPQSLWDTFCDVLADADSDSDTDEESDDDSV
ncbi:hypothetical protein Pelo_18986 [Pelomyxa schiedti]|nr:hypothetical protein Pelo_18986 [Pelomyxa schiedti]